SASSRSSSFRTNSAQSTRITTKLLTVTFQSHKEIIAIGAHVAIHVAVPAMSSIESGVSRARSSRVHPREHPHHVGFLLLTVGERPGGSAPRKARRFASGRGANSTTAFPERCPGRPCGCPSPPPFHGTDPGRVIRRPW